MVKVKRFCPLCLSEKFEPFLKARDTEGISPREYRYYRCGHCGLVFLFPLPGEKEISHFYQKDYFSGSRFLEWFQQERRLKIRGLKREGRLLDFGCGEGVFMSLMKKDGWQVAGFDASTQAISFARQKQLEIAAPPLTRKSFPAENFEVITLWHTLEHIPDPLPLLKTLRYFLTDEGFLVISVPNIASLEARIGRSKWFHLDPPRHCFHYDPKSLGFLLKKAGFKVVKIDHFSIEYNFPALWQTIVNRLGSRPNFFYHLLKRQPTANLSKREYFTSALITLFGGLVVFLPALCLSWLLSLLKQSGSMTVFAKKNEDKK